MAAAATDKKKKTNKSAKNVNKKTKTAVKTQNKGKKTVRESKPIEAQHREVWIIVLFFMALILLLSVLGIKGVVLDVFAGLTKGAIGFGAYLLPIAMFAASFILLFAHGKPVGSKMVCVFILPVLFGMLVHLTFCNIALTSHVIPKLYDTGKSLESGGVLSGGLAALLGAGISDVGAIVVVIICIVYCFMNLSSVKVKDVLDYFVGARDEAIERRDERRREKEEIEAEEERIRAEEERRAEEEARRIAAERANSAVKTAKPAAEDTIREKANESARRQVFDAELGRNITPGTTEPKKAADGKQKKRPSFDIPLEAEMPNARAEKKIQEQDAKSADLDISAAEFIENQFDDMLDEEPEPFEMPTQNVFEAEHYEEGSTDDPCDEEPDDPPFVPDPEPEPVVEKKPERVTLQPIPATVPAPIIDGEPDPDSEPVVVDTHQIPSEVNTAGEAALLRAQSSVQTVYEFPSVDLLHEDDYVPTDDATEELRVRSHKLSDTLQSFGVKAQIINVIRGPSITRYEIMLDRGVKFSRLTSLQDDIALALGSSGVRIAAIPDKSAVGIEVPNKVIQTVYLREVLTSKTMADNKSKLAFALGKDITGASIVGDIGKMPHMLIAGTTGSGKSVCINSIIVSMLYRASPQEVKLIMIDPKMVELGTYNGIPHLLVPVVTDYKKAAGALNWAVMEMDRRYKQLFDVGARDIDSYNRIMERNGEEKLPRIVIIIDELADLMMMAAKEIEESICRIAQKARAAGMHLVIATQRPSADVLTGLMKSNISSRIAFAVSSQIESRIILDQNGAEKLIGRGDMLFFPLGYPKPVRVQGCYLSTEEVEEVTEFIKQNGTADYSEEIIQHMERSATKDEGGSGDDDDDETDELFFEAVDIVMQSGQASATMLQRKLRLGYARASRIIDQMENRGIIGPFDGARPRQLLMSKSDWQEMKARRSI